MNKASDEFFMKIALEEAEKAAAEGEVPVGAVTVKDGAVIAACHNTMEQSHSALEHAEIAAIRKTSEITGDWRMDGITMYVTKEPCAMCSGAMINARLERLVYGMSDPRSGCAGSALDITGFPGMLHKVNVEGGILEDECKTLIRNFFQNVRNKNK